MKSSRGGQEGPFDFISNFFDEVIEVILRFFKWVTELFSDPFGEDYKKSNTKIKRKENVGEKAREEAPETHFPKNLFAQFQSVADPVNDRTDMSKSDKSASELEQLEQSFINGEINFVEDPDNSQRYILNLAPDLDKSLFRKQSSGELSQTQQSKSILNESSTSEGLSEEEMARVFCDIFTKHNREYKNIDDFINRFADGLIQRQYGEWLPDKIREVEKKTQIFADPTPSPFFRSTYSSAYKNSSPSSGEKKGATPRL